MGFYPFSEGVNFPKHLVRVRGQTRGYKQGKRHEKKKFVQQLLFFISLPHPRNIYNSRKSYANNNKKIRKIQISVLKNG